MFFLAEYYLSYAAQFSAGFATGIKFPSSGSTEQVVRKCALHFLDGTVGKSLAIDVRRKIWVQTAGDTVYYMHAQKKEQLLI